MLTRLRVGSRSFVGLIGCVPVALQFYLYTVLYMVMREGGRIAAP